MKVEEEFGLFPSSYTDPSFSGQRTGIMSMFFRLSLFRYRDIDVDNFFFPFFIVCLFRLLFERKIL